MRRCEWSLEGSKVVLLTPLVVHSSYQTQVVFQEDGHSSKRMDHYCNSYENYDSPVPVALPPPTPSHLPGELRRKKKKKKMKILTSFGQPTRLY